MELFPAKYRPYIRQYHVWGARLSGFLLSAGIAGMVLIGIAPSDYFRDTVRRTLGGLVIFGIPAGFILLIITISLVSYQYNKQRRELLGSRKLANSSINQSMTVLKTITHLKYDYHSAGKTGLKSMVLFIIIFAAIGTLLIIGDPQPAHALFIGLQFLVCPICILGFYWFILVNPKKNTYIELAVDGIHYQTNRKKSFLPWNKIKEIQNLRGSYAIRSDDDRLIIWSDIEPADIPSESFFAGLFRERPYVLELIESVKKLAPHIYQKESFLARDIKLPVSNKVIVVFLLTLVLLFFIVIIRGLTNI